MKDVLNPELHPELVQIARQTIANYSVEDCPEGILPEMHLKLSIVGAIMRHIHTQDSTFEQEVSDTEAMLAFAERCLAESRLSKNEDVKQLVRVCPRCEKEYIGYPAISRKDNKTPICSECGVEEALEQFAENQEG